MLYKKLLLFFGFLFAASNAQADGLKDAGQFLTAIGTVGAVVGAIYVITQESLYENLTQDAETSTVTTFDWGTLKSNTQTVTVSRPKPQAELVKNKEKIAEHGLKFLTGCGVTLCFIAVAAIGHHLADEHKSN